jgi:hypothetical protein
MGLNPLTGKHQRGQQVRSLKFFPGVQDPRIIDFWYPLGVDVAADGRVSGRVGATVPAGSRLGQHGENLQGAPAPSGHKQQHAEVAGFIRRSTTTLDLAAVELQGVAPSSSVAEEARGASFTE